MATTGEIQPAVRFEGVDFSYDGPIVLQDASFSIAPGGFVSIIGPNGGGKSTLLKLMLGLLKPQKGRIQVFGQPPRLSCSNIGYTPQFLTVDFSFPISVLDVVLMGRLRRTWNPCELWYGREDKKAAREAIRLMRLEEYMDAAFSKLSGGQRQRVLIARAICGEPKLLLLDEPTNNIDSNSERILSQILLELNRRMAIVVVSHDVGFVSECVGCVLCVNRNVAVHTTSQLDAQTIEDLYERSGMKLVLHDHH